MHQQNPTTHLLASQPHQHTPQPQPYQGLYSLPQPLDNHNHLRNPKQKPLVSHNTNLEEARINPHNKSSDTAIVYNIKIAIQRLSGFVSKSKEQLYEIERMKKGLVPQGGTRDRWLYLEKFYRDYMKFTSDLKSKQWQLESLLYMANLNQFSKESQEMLDTINSKYINILDKTLNFNEWKENLDSPDSLLFKLINKSALEDPEIAIIIESLAHKPQTNVSKSKMMASNISHSEVNIFPTNNTNVFRQSQASLSYSQSQATSFQRPNSDDFTKHRAQIRNTQQASSDLEDTGSLFLGSLVESAEIKDFDNNSQMVIEYSDAHSMRSSYLKKWIDNLGNKSQGEMSSSVEMDPFDPYVLGGSYHPMSMSSSSISSKFSAPRDLRLSQINTKSGRG